ncbi:hypothetical protein [Bacillus alkalisoli]|uniref:hypothetical protein n=1 Tax=Bacillus alkalisoli TaxID=2011008 RepID=UPI000C236C85|nr:hypothetical protein [Bacillus alkalisoli]
MINVTTISNLNQEWIEVLKENILGFEIHGLDYTATEDRDSLSRTSITKDFWVSILNLFDKKAQEDRKELTALQN